MSDHVIYSGDGAQTRRTIAYDKHGRAVAPSAATYTIVDLRRHEDDSDREIQASASATVDDFSDTTDAAAGLGTSDPTKVQLADSTGAAAGDRLLIVGSNGDQEVFEVRLVSGNDLYATKGLTQRYASGSTVQGVEVLWSFPAATADDEEELERRTPFGIDFVFTGVDPANVREIAWIQRRAAAGYATLDDLRNIDQLVVVYARKRVDPVVALAQANREIRGELLVRRRDPHQAQLGEVARLCAAWYALWLIYRQLGESFEERTVDARSRYRYWLESLLEDQVPLGAGESRRDIDSMSDAGVESHEPFFAES